MIRQLKQFGLRILGAKLTGAGRYHDILAMADAGADVVFDFVDAGLPSTICPSDEYREAMILLLGRMAELHADVAVVEIGASPLEPYNSDTAIALFEDCVRVTMLSTCDPYAALGVMTAFNAASRPGDRRGDEHRRRDRPDREADGGGGAEPARHHDLASFDQPAPGPAGPGLPGGPVIRRAQKARLAEPIEIRSDRSECDQRDVVKLVATRRVIVDLPDERLADGCRAGGRSGEKLPEPGIAEPLVLRVHGIGHAVGVQDHDVPRLQRGLRRPRRPSPARWPGAAPRRPCRAPRWCRCGGGSTDRDVRR